MILRRTLQAPRLLVEDMNLRETQDHPQRRLVGILFLYVYIDIARFFLLVQFELTFCLASGFEVKDHKRNRLT